MVDVPEGKERMETAAAFARRMMAKRGMPCRLTTSLDRRRALDGASFVISQIRVGQMAARRRDEHIPLKHGVIGQETTGAGGFANALRTIPVSLEIAKDVKDIALGRVALNFLKPVGPAFTEALTRYSDVKTFGLCGNAHRYQDGSCESPGRGTAQNQHRCFGFEPLAARHCDT